MKKIRISITTLIVCFCTSLAIAGESADAPVIIDLEDRSAQGSQTSARFSDNDVEVIGCGATVSDPGDGEVVTFGFCQATNAGGESITCFTFSPDLVAAISSIANYGFINFRWNEEGECVAVRNSTQSIYIPAFKTKK